MLAARSLAVISDSFVLDLSHMGFVSGVLTAAGFTESEKGAVLSAIGEKNLPELLSICKEKNLSEAMVKRVTGLATVYGPIGDVIEDLGALSVNIETEQALSELTTVYEVLKACGLSDKVQIDFSVVHDMKYYSKIVFRGYINGVPTGVLSGGQYDRLVEKIGKNAKAIGFAVYLDLLERLEKKNDGFDADVAIIYDESAFVCDVMKKAQEIAASGKTVLVKKSEQACRCRETIYITEGGAK